MGLILLYIFRGFRQNRSLLHSLGHRFCQPFLSQPLFLSLGLGRVFPGNIAVQILQQVVAGRLELIANQPQPCAACE